VREGAPGNTEAQLEERDQGHGVGSSYLLPQIPDQSWKETLHSHRP